jgi:hypothetical protein
MRFSANGYYIESYVKCDNCGVLIYDEGIRGLARTESMTFCSPWCREWRAQRLAGIESPRVDLAFDAEEKG